MEMQDILCRQSKETRCYIMAATLFFDRFNPTDAMAEINEELCLDVLGLTKEDMQSFPMSDYPQIASHLEHISDPNVRHWVITNTYAPVLKSGKAEAMNAFKKFCSDLGWDSNEIKESMESTEVLYELKPTESGSRSTGSAGNASGGTDSGCLFVVALILLSSLLCSFM